MSKKKKRIGRNLEGMIVETTTIERKMKNRLPHEKSLHPSYTIPPRCSDRFSSDSVLIFCLPFLRFLIMCYSPSRKNADWISISTIRENIYLHFSFRNKKFFRGEFLFCFLSILLFFFFFFFLEMEEIDQHPCIPRFSEKTIYSSSSSSSSSSCSNRWRCYLSLDW